MDKKDNGQSYRRFLRSSSIIGMAYILNILFGILRMKAVALLFGTVGVAVFGLMQNVMQVGSTVGSLGSGTMGTKQISATAADGDPQKMTAARDALIWGSTILALIGGVLFWIFGRPIMSALLGAEAEDLDVLWVSIGIAFTILGGAQIAFLTGSGRIGDVARVYVLSAFAGTAIGLGLVWFLGRQGLGAVVVMVAACTVLIAAWYVRSVKRPVRPFAPIRSALLQWQQMLGQGIPFMISSVVNLLGFLAVRALMQEELGLAALGLFQSAWTVGTMYLAFVLGAMTTDYFARLSALAGNEKALGELINEQTEVALLLCSPMILIVMAMAPLIIRLLFSAEFMPAAEVLRWLLLGDILRVLTLPLSYLLLATGQSRTYVLTETLGMMAFVATTALLLPYMGFVAGGLGYVLIYVAYLPAVWWLAQKSIGFRWRKSVLAHASCMMVLVTGLLILSYISAFATVAASIIAAVLFALVALVQLGRKANMDGRMGQIADLGRKVARRFKR